MRCAPASSPRAGTWRAREERKLSLATLGAEARPARDEDARPRVPLHDVSDPLEAAERAAARGIEAFDQALAAPGRSGVYGLAMQRAGAWLRRAWLHDPDRGHVAAKLAQVQYLLGDAAGAATTYAAAKALDPLLIEADVMHGVLQRDFGIDGGAKAAPAALERAARAASRPEGDADLAARAFFELARAWDEVGETDRALEACEEACRRGAERHAPVALKARLLSRLQRPEARQASRLAAVLLHRAPQPIEASRALVYQRAGEYCEDLNDVRAAVHFFTRAIESDPSNPVPWRRRGGRLFRTSPLEFPHAFLDITTAIELDPALASHFHDVERSLYRFRAFSDEFQDRVSEVVRAAPDMASALFVGGFWESFRGNPAEAKARFDEALELAPKWYLPLAYRGVCRVRLDDLAGAESDLREARRLWAKDGVIPFFEAALALRRGDKEGCYAKLREAITLEFKHGEIFRGSPDLAPLAGEARFERILDELGGDDGLFQFRRKKN